jgi:hypothetical protein
MASQQAVINTRPSGFKVQIQIGSKHTLFVSCVFSQPLVLALMLIWKTYLTVENSAVQNRAKGPGKTKFKKKIQ